MYAAPETSAYEALGGRTGIAELVDAFYDTMAAMPAAAGVWAMHHSDLAEVKARLLAFLSEWLGGPAAYTAAYGPPRMRRMHAVVSIGPRERDVWLDCMRQALDLCIPDRHLRAQLQEAFVAMAEHLRNREADGKAAGGCSGACHCRGAP